jgi:hypothetical protein
MEIHYVQDLEQNPNGIGKYLLLEIYLTCENPLKQYHRSRQIALLS